MINFVYITSLPRSGSTLLSMLMGSHGSVFSLGEFVLFGQALQHNSFCTCTKPIRECDFWSKVIKELNLTDHHFNTLVYPYEYRSTWLQKSLTLIYSRALLNHNRFQMGIAAAYKDGYAYHMEKALANSIRVFKILSRHFSDPDTILLDASKTVTRLNQFYLRQSFPVKVITLVRDGRGTVNSWLKDDRKPFIDMVRSWKYHMEKQRQVLQRIKAEDKIRLRYEDLCQNTESELRRLCDFLQIPYQEKMLEIEGPFHMLGGNPGTYKGTKTVCPDTGWIQNFDRERLALFDEIAGPLNRENGYGR